MGNTDKNHTRQEMFILPEIRAVRSIPPPTNYAAKNVHNHLLNILYERV